MTRRPIAAGDQGRSARHERQFASRLFLTCWLVYVLHSATNVVRETYPAISLGDSFSFDVSAYLGLHPDIFVAPSGAAFINGNPGASIVAAVPYAVARPLIDRATEYANERRSPEGSGDVVSYDSPWPLAREFHRKTREQGLDVKLGLAVATIQTFCMAPLTALSVVLMWYVILSRTGSGRAATALALLYGFATPVFYRTGSLNHNLMVMHCALLAFVILWRPWDAPSYPSRPSYGLAGLACGWSVVCDYSGVVVVLVLGLYGLLRRFTLPGELRARSDAVRFLAGALTSIAILVAYQWSSFGNAFLPAQSYMPPPGHGYESVSWPQINLLWKTAFDLRFGLFLSAPLLLVALYAPRWLRRERRILGPVELGCALVFTLAFFLFSSSIPYGNMQFNSGVRYVVPVTPFLFLLAAEVLLSMSATVAACIGVATTYWCWCLAMYREVELGLGVLEAPINITRSGPQLPWLTTLQRMGYVSGAWWPSLVLILSAAFIWAIWTVRWPPYGNSEYGLTRRVAASQP